MDNHEPPLNASVFKDSCGMIDLFLSQVDARGSDSFTLSKKLKKVKIVFILVFYIGLATMEEIVVEEDRVKSTSCADTHRDFCLVKKLTNVPLWIQNDHGPVATLSYSAQKVLFVELIYQ
jgi:hypothetical protein